MIMIENQEVTGFKAAIRGMRNPKNSWSKSDTTFWPEEDIPSLGTSDLLLASTLANAGDDHGKFLRMINVSIDITAPLYWWKEMDTYKVGTVADSCSTMHKIAAKEFTVDDFSHEHLTERSMQTLRGMINLLNVYRDEFNVSGRKDDWWQMIQLLPSSYNQRRTWQANYQVLRHIYKARHQHKLTEWLAFCGWIESLPYAMPLITGKDIL